VRKSDIERFQKRFSRDCVLVNGLSSTETATICKYFIDKNTKINTETIPIGYPVEDTEILLLDDRGEVVVPREIGNIVVKSRYLGLGYWRRPDLTNQVFSAEPVDENMRLYRTGDLGRRKPDGPLEHLGRKDFQVKIRGYRVDTSEVERALLTIENIKEIAVVQGNDREEETRLVAYIVPAVHPGPTADRLRAELSSLIPEYMIPSALVVIDSLPLNHNGKLDRAALPKPGNERPELTRPFTSSRNEVERKLGGIWAEVLGVDRVGIHDDFFDLGGHSLLASRLFVQIEKILGKRLPMSTLFYAPTIEQLAAILQQTEWRAPWSLLVPIQPSGSKPPFFWVSGESSDTLLPRYLGQDQPLYSFMHPCHDGKRARYGRLEDIASNHLRELRTVQPTGPYYLGGSCFGGMVAFEMAQQLRQQGQTVALLALLDLATIKNCKLFIGRFSTDQESLSAEALRHVHELATLGPKEKLEYVRIRAKDRLNEVVSGGRNLGERAVRAACKLYVMSGRPVPLSIRLHYISAVDRKILRQYQPKPYPGRLIHFKAEGNSFDTELVSRLSCGTFENHDVPGRHLEVAKEPHVQVWATKLKTYLEQAQKQALQNA
jgi:thioesterase domain-containing protein/acyl carrier protein